MKTKEKRFAVILLSICMLLGMMPSFGLTALAAENDNTGLCEHHPEHTQECGYQEAVPSMPCLHEHNEDCYQETTLCLHVHTEECYPKEASEDTANPDGAGSDREPSACTHVCSVENGCITQQLICPHEHNESCGFKPGRDGHSCDYVCELCNSMEISTLSDNEEDTAKIKATVNGADKIYSVGETADSAQNVYASDFDALKAAIDEADNGSTVLLESDLTLDENGITINKDLSINLQQHTITAETTASNYSQIFTVKGDVKLSNGTMVAESGKVVSAGSTASGAYKLEINNMTIQSKSAEVIYFSNSMDEVTIKNSDFSLLEGANAYYIINSSTYDTGAVKNYTIVNSTFDASSAAGGYIYPVQINAVNANITGCTFKSVGTNAVNRYGTTLYIFENGTATVSDSTFISETASEKKSEALNINYKSNGTINLTNNVFGSKLVLGNNDTYTVNINGSKFNTSEPITVNTKVPTLNINKAYFVDDSIKGTSLLDATHPIMSNTEDNKDEYPYVVALRDDASDAICYVPSTDAFYPTIEAAKVAAAGSEIQLLQDITLDDFSTNINAKGYTVTTTQTIASQLSGIKGLSNAKLVGTDGEISNVSIENGKIVRGNPSDSLEELAYSNLHAGSLIDSDTKEIKSADAFVAKIGNYGYTSFVSAITVATKDDAANPVQETITLLKDIKNSADIYYNKSSFILDLNGFTLGGENVNNGVMISGASAELTPNDCNIIITDSSQGKTGKIVAKNFGVVTNGSLTGVTLKLDGVTVESASIGVYFPSNKSELTIKDSTIKGNTGLAIKGGTVNLIDSEIHANGEKNVPTEAVSSGVNDTGDAIYIEGNYSTNIKLNIQSGKYTSENGFALQDLFVDNAAVAGEIEGGSFSSNPDEKYLSDEVKTIVKLSSSDTPFVIGTAAEEALASLTPGEEVELIKADAALTLPDGVVVKNATGHDITVNGIIIADGVTEDAHTHNAVKTEAKAETCTQDGNTAYWYCEGCKKYFSDEACTTETTLEATVILAKGHGETEIKNAKAATCTEEGYTGDKVCKDCGEVLEKGKPIAKLAHTYKNGKCTICGVSDPNYRPTTEPTVNPGNNVPKPTDKPTSSPQTGDNSNIWMWVALLFVSAGGVLGTTVYIRIRQRTE